MSFEDKLRIGPGFAWIRVPVDDTLRTTLSNTGTPVDDALTGLAWPAVGQYAGRTQGGFHIKPSYKEDVETLQGVETEVDCFALEQKIEISANLVFNGDPDVENIYQLPEIQTPYGATGGGLTPIPKFSLLIAMTNLENPIEKYKYVVQWRLYFRVRAITQEEVVSKEFTAVNVTFKAMTRLDTDLCPGMDGSQLYSRWFTNILLDPNQMINPRNPNTPIVNTPDDYYYLQPTAFFNL